MTRHRRRNNKERDEAKYANIIPVENGPADDSRWPHFSDEDYIVFCFRENGGFDVVKETSRSVNRKVGSNSTDLCLLYLKSWEKISLLYLFIYSCPLLRFGLKKQLNYGEESKTGVKRYGNGEKLNRNGRDGHVMVSDQKVYK